MDKLHYCSDANEKSINQKVGYQGVLKKSSWATKVSLFKTGQMGTLSGQEGLDSLGSGYGPMTGFCEEYFLFHKRY